MSNGQGVITRDRNPKHFKESGNRRTKERKKGKGLLLRVHHLTTI